MAQPTTTPTPAASKNAAPVKFTKSTTLGDMLGTVHKGQGAFDLTLRVQGAWELKAAQVRQSSSFNAADIAASVALFASPEIAELVVSNLKAKAAIEAEERRSMGEQSWSCAGLVTRIG